MSDVHTSHTGPRRSSNQVLWIAFFAFVLPLVVVVGLLTLFAQTDTRPAAEVDQDLATAMRIQPVGSVAVRAAQRTLQAGDAVYRMQCAACHDGGLLGAPKFGVAADWSARLGQGLDALLQSTLKGKGAMAAQGGGAFADIEIARAVVFLANAAGGQFEEPAAPTAAAQ